MKKYIVISILLLLNCCDLSENVVNAEEKKYHISSIGNWIDLSVEEPSGLAISSDKKYLYTVSDQTGEIYKLDLNGNVLLTIKLKETLDLEGICCDKNSDNLWIVEEKTRELLEVSQSGEILFRKRMLSGEDNSGLEGVCFGKNGNLVLLKEKNPAYFIELNDSLEISSQIELTFENDFSAITYDPDIEEYMVLSQQGKKLIFYIPGKNPVQRISLPMDNAEGIAYDSSTGILYIVDDDSGKMYKYSLEVE